MNLPIKTRVHRVFPKEKFYRNLDISTSLKNSFIQEIEKIYWEYKISPQIINIEKGKTVDEIEVFLIRLKQKELNEKVLLQMDKQIPYHMIFILEFEGLYKAVIGYKEESKLGGSAFKVNAFYYTKWMKLNELPIELNGLNLDVVYENFLRDIAGERLKAKDDETIEESVQRDEERQKLEKEIEKLEKKRKNTKQLNKKMKINDNIKALKKELMKLN